MTKVPIRKTIHRKVRQVLELEAQRLYSQACHSKYLSNHIALNVCLQSRGETTTSRFDWPLYLSELETKENEMLEIHIKNCPYEIVRQKDEKGFTLLHHAVLKCIPGKVEKLI